MDCRVDGVMGQILLGSKCVNFSVDQVGLTRYTFYPTLLFFFVSNWCGKCDYTNYIVSVITKYFELNNYMRFYCFTH